jgi:hypothetical protein
MPYNTFTLEQVITEFDLEYREEQHIFAEVENVQPSAWLQETLEFNIPLAVAIASEKARSEMIIAPILWEIKRRHPEISIFSGREFNVDAARGLTGFVDFLIARSSVQAFISLPVVVVVEAKKSDLASGHGQCAAEMIAAQIKNSLKEADEVRWMLKDGILGVVSTGSLWQFLILEERRLTLDLVEYSISELSTLLGIFEMFATFTS